MGASKGCIGSSVGHLMADLAPDLVAALQLGPDLIVPPDLVAQLPWEEDQGNSK